MTFFFVSVHLSNRFIIYERSTKLYLTGWQEPNYMIINIVIITIVVSIDYNIGV